MAEDLAKAEAFSGWTRRHIINKCAWSLWSDASDERKKEMYAKASDHKSAGKVRYTASRLPVAADDDAKTCEEFVADAKIQKWKKRDLASFGAEVLKEARKFTLPVSLLASNLRSLWEQTQALHKRKT